MIRRFHAICFYLIILSLSTKFGYCWYRNPIVEKIPGLTSDPFLKRQNAELEEKWFNATMVEKGSKLAKLKYNKDDIVFNLDISPISLYFKEVAGDFLINLNVTYKSPISNLAVTLYSNSENVVKLGEPQWFILSKSDQLRNTSIGIDIIPQYLGKAFIVIWARPITTLPRKLSNSDLPTAINNISDASAMETEYWDALDKDYIDTDPIYGLKIIVSRVNGPVQLIFRVIIVFMVIVITFSMGCELSITVIISILKKPVGPIIGFTSQYCIMPLVSFMLAYFIPMSKEFGFGLLTMGCCPGGGASNIWCLLLGGDLNLSMTMTFISSISALGMMPFLMFVYGRYFIDPSRVKIPYAEISMNLLMLLLPVIGGMLLAYKRPLWAKKVTVITKPLAIIFIIYILTFGVYANISIYRLMAFYPVLLPIGALLPWIAFVVACLFAKLMCQSKANIITIGIETCIQNTGIAIILLLYSMQKPEGELGAVMPIIVSMFTPLPFYVCLIGRTIRQKCCKKSDKFNDEKLYIEDDYIAGENTKKTIPNCPEPRTSSAKI